MVNLSDSGVTAEQTSYLSGFVSGILQGRELPFLGQDGERRFTHEPEYLRFFQARFAPVRGNRVLMD